MGLFEKNLLPDEQIIYSTKKHIIIFFTPLIWAIAAGILVFNSEPIISKVGLLFGAFAAVTFVNQYLNYITSGFAITNKRIMMKEGFFIRHANDLRLSTVSNTTVNQSLLGQLLNYGMVVINPFGGSSDTFNDIAHPFEFQKQAQAQLDKISRV